MIKAIETEYNGYRFRSRLEARWAVVLDALSIEWRYEDEGYELKDGTRYLPDFWCPDLLQWFEVKPSIKPIDKEAERKASMLADASSCPVLVIGELEDKILWIDYIGWNIWPGYFAELWGQLKINEALKQAKQARFEQ